jgi:hypothetical protein
LELTVKPARQHLHRVFLGIVFAGGALGITNAAARDVPALIVQPTDQSRAALQQVVSQALKRESVLLSSDALTQDNTLTIEPTRARDPQGQFIYDRDVRAIEHFQLVKSWWRCILIREATQTRYKLADTKCKAKP